MKKYDFVIIGGGIFGAYAALYLARNKQKVLLVEKESQLLTKASVVNQARLHNGYHYPRSIATAIMSNENKARFTSDHQDFIHAEFDKYYGIDRFASFTDQSQFQRFCDFLNIRCIPVEDHPWIDMTRLEALFLTTEPTFDPVLIAHFYRRQLKDQAGIDVLLQSRVELARSDGDHWLLTIRQAGKAEKLEISALQAINATYSGSNAINRLFGVDDIDLMHEISEIVLVTSPEMRNTGLTVMDGQFGSLMPYGRSGLLSLSSVSYTHHKVSYSNLPVFDCQAVRTDCRPDFPGNCNYCPARPRSNRHKMMSQIKLYLQPKVRLSFFKSMFTIKSKLKANYIDDGRPTEISVLNEKPGFYCIFAGKINSIYELEKVIAF